MSIPNWFYPIVMLWLIVVPLLNRSTPEVSSRRMIWSMLMDTLFLLPWILSLLHNEPIAAWIGLEIVGLVLLFDLLWRQPTELLREAWVKLSINWLLSWLMVGTAVALSGVHPVIENLFFPLPLAEVDRIRPVLAAVMFLLGISLKLGLPPFQQGVIDVMEVVDSGSHSRLALLFRWAIVYAAWQLMPSLISPLSSFNQQMFVIVLLFGCLCAWLVAGVQAGVQRTLSYMGTLLVVPSILSWLFVDPLVGVEGTQTLIVWGVTILGFLILGWLYQSWPESSLKESDILLWTDTASPCALPDWSWRWNLWMSWCICACLGMVALSFLSQHWIIGTITLLLAFAAASAGLKQLGMATWFQQRS